jgi:hypothetical protein
VVAFVVDNVHSPLGPSSSDRWLACSGSVLLTRGMPDPGSWFACEGTAAHTVSEWARVENRPAHDFIGRVLKVDEYEFTVDQEMADGVDEFVTAVETTPGVPLYEVKVHYDRWVKNGFGTLDDGRLNEDVVYISDFKYGKGVQVFAHENSQLKLYAAGVLQDFGWLYPDVERFVLRIYQPRLNHIDEFEVTKPRLLEWLNDEVKPIAERALLPGAPLKAGEHCYFCPAKATCKVRAELVLQTVSGSFGDLDAPQNLAVLTNDEIAGILPHLENVKKWCGDVEAHALAAKVRGEKVGDFKVVEGRSFREYAVTMDKVAETLEPVIGSQLWAPREMRSPAQVEKLLGGPKKAAPILKAIVRKPRGKPTLVPGSDPRPEMVVDVTADFGDLGA